jgi:Glu-tRNA(Gln) amidotransferase subunit E-like FAD-binding protein
MYPDTDSAPLPVDEERIERIQKALPLLPWEWRERFQHLLGRELVDQMIDRNLIQLFDRLLVRTGSDPKLTAVTLLNARKAVLRSIEQTAEGASLQHAQKNETPPRWSSPGKGAVFSQKQIDALAGILEAHRRGDVFREEIPGIFGRILAGDDARRVLRERGAHATEQEIREAVREVLDENRKSTGLDLSGLIGLVKCRISRPVDGKAVQRILHREEVRGGSGER